MINYHCELCEYETSKKYNFTRHMESHHKIERELAEDLSICTFCSKKFSNKYNCRRHVEGFCPQRPVAQNVIPASQNVSIDSQNVSMNSQNVSIDSQNVSIDSHNVSINLQNVISDEKDEQKEENWLCEKCNKSFSCSFSLRRHEPICKETQDYLQCPFCEKKFQHFSSKSRHVADCKKKYYDDAGNQLALIPSTSTDVATTNNVNHGVQNNYQNSTINNHNTQINNNNTQNITMNIQVNNWGQERVDHITPEMMNEFTRQIHGNGVANLIEHIHFDPDVPENNNVRIASIKGHTLMVYENNEWRIKDTNAVIHLLIGNGCRMLFNHYGKSEEIRHEDKTQNHHVIYKSLLDVSTRQPDVYYPTRRKIMASIRNLEHQTKTRRSRLRSGRQSTVVASS